MGAAVGTEKTFSRLRNTAPAQQIHVGGSQKLHEKQIYDAICPGHETLRLRSKTTDWDQKKESTLGLLGELTDTRPGQIQEEMQKEMTEHVSRRRNERSGQIKKANIKKERFA